MSKISITPNPSGSGVFTISSPATSTDRTLTLPDEAGTVLTSASSIPTSALTGDITQNAGPAFSAYLYGNQTVSSNTWTKVTLNIEDFDTNSNFASSRFTPTVAGYYQINAQVSNDYTGHSSGTFGAAIYKNGSVYAWQRLANSVSGWAYGTNIVSAVIYFNGSTDYVELYGLNPNVLPFFNGQIHQTKMSGILVRTA